MKPQRAHHHGSSPKSAARENNPWISTMASPGLATRMTRMTCASPLEKVRFGHLLRTRNPSAASLRCRMYFPAPSRPRRMRGGQEFSGAIPCATRPACLWASDTRLGNTSASASLTCTSFQCGSASPKCEPSQGPLGARGLRIAPPSSALGPGEDTIADLSEALLSN